MIYEPDEVFGRDRGQALLTTFSKPSGPLGRREYPSTQLVVNDYEYILHLVRVGGEFGVIGGRAALQFNAERLGDIELLEIESCVGRVECCGVEPSVNTVLRQTNLCRGYRVAVVIDIRENRIVSRRLNTAREKINFLDHNISLLDEER